MIIETRASKSASFHLKADSKQGNVFTQKMINSEAKAIVFL